jgi:5-carboxymethyl-2-hydroxymuconate isomerase
MYGIIYQSQQPSIENPYLVDGVWKDWWLGYDPENESSITSEEQAREIGHKIHDEYVKKVEELEKAKNELQKAKNELEKAHADIKLWKGKCKDANQMLSQKEVFLATEVKDRDRWIDMYKGSKKMCEDLEHELEIQKTKALQERKELEQKIKQLTSQHGKEKEENGQYEVNIATFDSDLMVEVESYHRFVLQNDELKIDMGYRHGETVYNIISWTDVDTYNGPYGDKGAKLSFKVRGRKEPINIDIDTDGTKVLLFLLLCNKRNAITSTYGVHAYFSRHSAWCWS